MGAAIATNSLENKAQTALAQEVSLRRAHHAATPLGGTQRLELDMGSDVLTNRTKVFAESQGWTIYDFAPGNPCACRCTPPASRQSTLTTSSNTPDRCST